MGGGYRRVRAAAAEVGMERKIVTRGEREQMKGKVVMEERLGG